YLHRLRSAAEAHREQHGFPHWVLYDEAQLLGTEEEVRWRRQGGYVLSSFAPAALPAKEFDAGDVVLDLTDAPDSFEEIAPNPVRRATVRFGSGPPRPFTIALRRTAHVRHRHKYADVTLPRERRFYFRTAEGRPLVTAATMREFGAAVRDLDAAALQFHLERGDFSHWLDTTITDKDMAAEVAVWEDQLLARRAAELERIRQQIVRAVEERYLAPDHHG
ncbi:MAG TPA: HAD family hydrolase, partial [Mycobacterium sp.]|nr:HAD family hydrolase [Mycobacterium sp.]